MQVLHWLLGGPQMVSQFLVSSAVRCLQDREPFLPNMTAFSTDAAWVLYGPTVFVSLLDNLQPFFNGLLLLILTNRGLGADWGLGLALKALKRTASLICGILTLLIIFCWCHPNASTICSTAALELHAACLSLLKCTNDAVMIGHKMQMKS